MKNNLLKTLPLIILLFVGLGCSAINQIKKKVEETQKPKVLECTDRKCQLTVPGDWNVETDLNDVANFQAGNRFKEQYAIVISDNKADFADEMTLDEYVELTRKDMENSTTDAEVSETKSITINGYPAKQFEVSGTVERVKARWIYTFIDAPKNYHRILAWTLTSKFEENKPVLSDVINSFKELDGTKTAPPPPPPPAPKKGK
jgi:hypothetical protein